MLPTFNTNRLLLRPFTEDDVDAVFEFGSNPKVSKYTGDPVLTSRQEAMHIIKNVWLTDYATYDYGRYAVIYKPDDKLIGFSGLKMDTKLGLTDIGYRFLPNYWGMGIATESCHPFIEWGFKNLQLHKIVGLAYPENIASCRVLEKIGLKLYKSGPFPGETKICHWYRKNNPLIYG